LIERIGADQRCNRPSRRGPWRETKEQARALIIADNKLAELARWDEDLLAAELQELPELSSTSEPEVLGFVTAEIDFLIGTAKKHADADPAAMECARPLLVAPPSPHFRQNP